MQNSSLKTLSDKKQVSRQKIGSRIWELDFVRGICIILMIWDHLMVLCDGFFSNAWAVIVGTDGFVNFDIFVQEYLVSTLRLFVQPLVVVCFFTLCGISCSFSKNNTKRGIIMLACCIAITIATYFLGIPIWFGALHLLTAGILLWSVIAYFGKKNIDITIVVAFFMGAFMFFLDSYFTLRGSNVSNNFLAIFGKYFVPPAFYSSDYYPIIPYIGFVLFGAAIGLSVYKNRKSKIDALASPRWYAPVNFVGRNGLVIYVLHQVVIGAILALASFFFITPGDFLLF